MDKLRDFLKSRTGQVLLMLCLSPVVLVGFEGLFQGSSLSPNQLAKVGDLSIATEAVQNEANATRATLTSRGIDGALIDDKALNMQAYENLLSRTLLEAQSKVLGMQISDEMISRLLQQDPQFLDANGKFSNDLFAQFLTGNRMTKDMLFANYRTQLNIRQLSGGILGASIFPNEQVSRLIDLQTESRPVWVKRLAWQHYVPQVNVSESDIAAYYEANKEKLNSSALVDLAYLTLSVADIPEPSVSDDELQVAYQNYLKKNNLNSKTVSQILFTGDKAKERADQIASELKVGKDFAELAKQHSDDPSGKTGGDIGTFNPAVFGEDAGKVEQALANVAVGETSEPIQTAFGWQIFKVTKADKAPSLDELKAELTKLVIEEKRNATLADLTANINSMAADGYALNDIATELKLKSQTIKDYPQTDNQTALNQPILISTAFDDNLLAGQSVSGSLTVNGQLVWVQPSNYRQSAPMNLDTARPKIVEILTKQKASELALADAQKLVQNFDKNQVKDFVSLGMVNRQSSILSDKERAELFAKPANKDSLVAWAVLTDEGASVLVGGDISTQATSRMSEVERAVASNMIREIAGQDHLEDYLHYLRQNLEVQTNEEAFKGL